MGNGYMSREAMNKIMDLVKEAQEKDKQEFEAFKASGIYGVLPDGSKIHPVEWSPLGWDRWEDEQGNSYSVQRKVNTDGCEIREATTEEASDTGA